MRIKITFASEKSGIIDFNYQHQIQAVIYGFLSRSDPDYASWLHEQGFVYKQDKRFKLFVFSGITFHGPIKIKSSSHSNSLNGFSFIASLSNPFTFSFQIASPVDRFLQHLINGIFKEGNEIRLGRQSLNVNRVETLPDPVDLNSEIRNPNSEILLKPLESPIFIKKPMPEGERDIYLFPGDEEYEEFLNQNLMRKYETLYGMPYKREPLKFDFKISQSSIPSPLWGEGHGEGSIRGKTCNPQPKTKLVKSFKVFKDGKVTGEIKGSLQPFVVSGSIELIRIGLECGFGQNNSMGCGYVI
ncbi:MAG: CRISPR-associated endoribonuclease Cas6 [Nitrospirae bacterium]|nr:CRISPR-associated endoribonuclease Cas6 [Nitrospirota bacterium]